jgi:clan AA aspartic protease
MGMTYVEGTVGDDGKQFDEVRFLVDSGAMYSLIPKATWIKLGLYPHRQFKFELADGQIIERPMSECRIKLLGFEGHTPVVLGEEGDEPLLGTITLEQFGFVLDPFKRKLIPVKVRR